MQQIANPMTKCLVLEIDTQYLAKFLERENDYRPLRIICPYGRQPEALYVVVRDSYDSRITFSYSLRSGLIDFMKDVSAELKSDGTFVLTGD